MTSPLQRSARFASLAFVALASGACAALLGIEDRVLDDGVVLDDGSAAPMNVDDGGAADAQDADADAELPQLSCGDAGTVVSSCSACSSGVATCGGTCVSDCTSACDPATLGCFTCPGGPPTGTCEPATADASCIANPLYAHCPCNGDPSLCPGANQVCVLNECRTCGEPLTAGEVCRDGTGKKVCKSATDPDPTKRLRCR